MNANPKHRVSIWVMAVFLATAVSAQATLLDFDALAASTNLGGIPNNPASVLSTNLNGDGIVFGRAGVSAGVAVVTYLGEAFSEPNFISGLNNAGSLIGNVAGDLYFHFVVPGTLISAATNSLSFVIGDSGGDFDSWTIRAFNLAGVLIDTQMLSGDSYQVYSLNMGGIHRIEIDNTTGTTAGFAVDDLDFDTPAGAAPEPTMLGLLFVGVLALARRRARSPETE
jgi:hypothetical protein